MFGARTPKLLLFLVLAMPWAVFVIGVALSGGLNVWPMGAARTWLRFLQDGPGADAARLFWAVDARNPLSPWWYIILVRPLSHVTNAVMLLLQMAMGLVVGVCSYLMADEVSRGRGRSLAFGLGIVVSLFMANRAVDGVHWNFLGALSCSLLSIWAYGIFVRKGRENSYWLVASLLFYFVALATYSIQIGGLLAVSVVAFLSGRTLRERFALLIKDTMPYATFLILFLLIWRTTSSVSESPLTPTLSGALQSIMQGIWHADYTYFIHQAMYPLPWIGLVSVTVFVAVLISYRLLPELAKSTSLSDISVIFAVGAALVVPTIALEASSRGWPPGSRWPMVQQFWTPLIISTILAAAILLIPWSRGRRAAWVFGIACCAALAAFVSAGMIQHIVLATAQERIFMAALGQIARVDAAAGMAFPRHYIIKLTDGAWGPSDSYVNTGYTRTEFPDLPLFTYQYEPMMRGGEPLRLMSDGAQNVAANFAEKTAYERIAFLLWDGKVMTRLPPPG